MARKQYWVVPASGTWDVKHAGRVLSHHYLKSAAVEAGRKEALGNQPSQLLVMKANGQIEYEHTYGQDPNPPRG